LPPAHSVSTTLALPRQLPREVSSMAARLRLVASNSSGGSLSDTQSTPIGARSFDPPPCSRRSEDASSEDNLRRLRRLRPELAGLLDDMARDMLEMVQRRGR
jgi:hypothetical protein